MCRLVCRLILVLFFFVAVLQNFAHPGRVFGRFGVGTEFTPFVTLCLGVKFVVCFVADSKVIREAGLLLPLAAMSLCFMSRCAFSTSGVSHGGF